MKKILSVAGCMLVAFFICCTGCKEIGPSVNLTPERVGNYDSVYSLLPAEAAALTADPHNVLVEEFTGQTCLNCPSAHLTLETISKKYPGRINVLGLYLFNITQAFPPHDAKYDFRDSSAFSIGSTIYGGIGGLPSGGVDRLLSTGTNTIEISRTMWSGNIDAQLLVSSPANLSVSSNYDNATQTAKIVVTVTYVENTDAKQNLSVVLTEEGMIDKQEFPDGIHEEYEFNNVFRDMISSAPSGSPIMDSVATKTRGMVLKRTFNYKVKAKSPAIVPANCHVVAFINGTGTDKRIVQSAHAKLVP